MNKNCDNKTESTPKPIARPLNSDQRRVIDNMKAEIRRNEIKAVSFKMSGTLVLRPFLSRQELWCFMEKDFKDLYIGKRSFCDLREDAETAVARKDSKNNKKKKPKKQAKSYFERIYDALMKSSKISPSSREKLMKRECELEEYFSFARKSGLELFREAKNCGKKIIITVSSAGCPLPKEHIENILKKCGYDGYDMLVFPEECDVSTAVGGNLYEYIPKQLGITPVELLHIGSSVVLDVEEPIKKGVRALLLSNPRDLFVKSGRLKAFTLTKHQYDYHEPQYSALRGALGLYAVYAFDYPHNKHPQSDFCNDDYMMGFITLGPLSLYKDIVVSDELEMQILGAMSENKKITQGRDDFLNMYQQHFGFGLENYGLKECDLPFRFFFKHGALHDRMCLQKHISADVFGDWTKQITEPEIIPIYLGRGPKSGLSKLADRLFPPGTQVRIYAEGVLAKLRPKKKF